MYAAEAAGVPTNGGFEEKAFFEYHLYTLGRPTTLPDNSTKQIELFPAAREVPCEKVMVYYGAGSKQLTRFLQRRAAMIKLGMALLFAALATWLALSISGIGKIA